jgi:hypothetical protein
MVRSGCDHRSVRATTEVASTGGRMSSKRGRGGKRGKGRRIEHPPGADRSVARDPFDGLGEAAARAAASPEVAEPSWVPRQPLTSNSIAEWESGPWPGRSWFAFKPLISVDDFLDQKMDELVALVQECRRTLTVDRITAVFAHLTAADRSSDVIMYVGDDVLRCSQCDGLMRGGHLVRQSYPDPLTADYWCPNRDHRLFRVSVRIVDRKLQTLTAARFAQREVVATWRVARAAELDAHIAEALAIRAWCENKERRRELDRKLRTENRFRHVLARVVGDGDNVQWSLDKLAKRTIDLVAERAAIATEERPTGGRNLSIPNLTWGEYVRALSDRTIRRAFAREPGIGDRQLDAYRKELESRLGDDLAISYWQAAGRMRPPSVDNALTQDWAQSPNRMVRRRRELLLMAIGSNRLVIEPASGGDCRIHLVSSPTQ